MSKVTGNRPPLHVCLTPSLLPGYDTRGKIVVVIDVFRASSAIVTAVANGIHIIPVNSVEEAQAYKDKGYIAAAERKGAVVDGFDFGNSPFAFMDPELKGREVVLTTSNCTVALHEVGEASQILLGAFTNFSAITDYIKASKKGVVLLCAGWRNRYSLEDTLFAGALAESLQDSYSEECDAAFSAKVLYNTARHDLPAFLQNSSHRHRLSHLNIEEDLEYCMQYDVVNVVPEFKNELIKAVEVEV